MLERYNLPFLPIFALRGEEILKRYRVRSLCSPEVVKLKDPPPWGERCWSSGGGASCLYDIILTEV
jgi:hypothetical protein